jgi:hypothetical protein
MMSECIGKDILMSDRTAGCREEAAAHPCCHWCGFTDEFLVCPTVFFAAKMRKIRNKVKFSGLLSSVFKSSVFKSSV